MSHPRLAAIVTCYNRRDTTLKCLRSIYEQDINCDIYLVDDGSSDGTWDAVKSHYPAVKLILGDGNLFWGGGMRLAFSHAMKVGYDYYIWLNDDTKLDANVFSHLIYIHQSLAEQGKSDSIIVGSTKDPVTGKATYGGMVRLSRWRRLNFSLLEPTQELQECETMNGNCVLIPQTVVQKVGNIDDAFIHDFGDWDYGLKARKLGCSVWVAPGYIGTCSGNPLRGTWKDTKLSALERLKKASGIKGGLDPQVWKLFAQRYAGRFWYIYWISPYVRLLVASILKTVEHPSIKGTK